MRKYIITQRDKDNKPLDSTDVMSKNESYAYFFAKKIKWKNKIHPDCTHITTEVRNSVGEINLLNARLLDSPINISSALQRKPIEPFKVPIIPITKGKINYNPIKVSPVKPVGGSGKFFMKFFKRKPKQRPAGYRETIRRFAQRS